MQAQLEHENMIEAIALAGANVEGAVVRRVDGVALIATGLPLRLFNQVIIESDDALADAVRVAVGLTRARGDQFLVNLRVGADDRLIPLMHELALAPLSEEPWMPGMALEPISAAAGPDTTSDHEIQQVTDEVGIEDHITIAAAGFELPESVLRSIITPAMARRAGVAAYVGYTEDRPVTTGLGIRTGRTIGVYNVATLPAVRRRGFGASMTARVVADGAAAGCDVAILQSSAMGHSVYERLGFRTVVEYMGYVDAADGSPRPH